MRRTIAHSVRGRLRVRYPAHWLEPRCSAIESELKAVPGVRAVHGRPLTGSLRIDYDPYRLAAEAIVDRLDRMTAELVAPPQSKLTHPKGRQRQTLPSAPMLKMIGATSVLVTACCLPVPPAITAGLLLASGAPAATTLEHGEIEIRAEQLGPNTAVGRIVSAIEAAATEKPDIQLFAERLADREVWRTLTLAGLGGAFSRSFDAAMAILVADYGTAARVGIPTAILTSLRRAASEGILVKGPRTLERLARVDTIVFDKTGTLTSGTLHVTRVVSYDKTLDEGELVRLGAAAEHGFTHPVARAVGRLARERRIEVPPVTGTESSLGLGLDVWVEDRRVLIGSRRFMEQHRVGLERARSDEAAAHAVGASPLFVAIDHRLAGMLELQDQLRDDAPDAVRALRARKMRNVIMLSGDHPEPSRVIADSLGLRHHYAELLPEDKARLVRELKAEGRVVAMVGDGVNDALGLQAADVGMAVPGGAAVAAEAADIILLSGGLDRVVRALDLARESIVAVRQTLGVAARANLGVVGLASVGWGCPLTGILLSHGTTVAAAVVTAARGAARPPSSLAE